MDAQRQFQRYRELQDYVGWSPDDQRRIDAARPLLEPHFVALVDDFYDEIKRHEPTRRVITGGERQIDQLKRTLTRWLDELLRGPYDAQYVARRWSVGYRHVEIGLDQVFTNVALSRLRSGMLTLLGRNWQGAQAELLATCGSLNRLVDLDLAIIEDAYQTEYVARHRRADQRRIELEKERHEAIFRNLVEVAQSMIVILRADHTIAYFNPFAEELTGYRAEEVQGRDYFPIFLPEEERPGVALNFEKLMAGAEPTRGYENAVLCRDGSRRWILWNANVLEDFEGGPGVLAIGQDMTAFKQTHARLVETERLAAIGQMVAGLAHESRNALQRSQACLEMLTLEVSGHPDALDLVQRTQRAQEHLHHLYEEVRGYAAPIRLQREPCDLGELWRAVWNDLEAMRKHKRVVLQDAKRGIDLVCQVDAHRVAQVFRNVLENAIAACPDPGEVRIECAESELYGTPGVRVSICDNGPGLDLEQARRIFDPFYTTKTQGTGLGMAIAKRLVEAHGGRITVGDSETGARIDILLPRQSP